MPDVMKALLLNPPSFANFDGGASSRWPVTREIESYWYPVWLTYAAGMLPGSRLLDACPHKITPAQTIEIATDHDFVVLFTSTVGFHNDLCLIRKMKERKPDLKIAFVGPHVQNLPDQSLMASEDIDFVVRGEFDHAVVEFAQGRPLAESLGVSYRKDGKVMHTPPRPQWTPSSWTRCLLPPKCTSGIWRSKTTTCRSCCTPLSRCTRRGAAPRYAPSASGRRRSPVM